MFSLLNPKFLYSDVSSDVAEHDVDVVSDMWTMDGRDVYRGSRDPRYSHANVYWLYDEDLRRVGCSEHSVDDHADFRLLWFADNDFGTLFQEDWTVGDNIWSLLPQHVFEKFLAEGWSTPETFLEQCLNGPTRVVTAEMLVNMPTVYSCSKCGRKSLTRSGCMTEASRLDFPDTQKIFFVDDDMIVHQPPPDHSNVWRIIPQTSQHGGDSSRAQAEEQPQQPAPSEQTSPAAPPSPPGQPASAEGHATPPQSHPQTPEQP